MTAPNILEVGFHTSTPVDGILGQNTLSMRVQRTERNRLRRGTGSKIVFEIKRGTVEVPMSAVAWVLLERPEE